MLWLCQLQQPEQRTGSHTGLNDDDVLDDDVIGDDDDGNGDHANGDDEEGNDGDYDVAATNRGS